ncbi:hypothetical protein BN1723_006061 [Verticillium longisporum]|uniref:Uncharacterized protein n=1 Tax=Verticillium longisporum TaxID=100787 RepID=A0A0G4ND02_VERLO|nr:hypothetical protein BN1723_006061 [Verticillium longisporum]
MFVIASGDANFRHSSLKTRVGVSRIPHLALRSSGEGRGNATHTRPAPTVGPPIAGVFPMTALVLKMKADIARLVKLAAEEALKLAKAGPTARRAFRCVGVLGGSEEEKRGEGQREEDRLPKGVVRDDSP